MKCLLSALLAAMLLLSPGTGRAETLIASSDFHLNAGADAHAFDALARVASDGDVLLVLGDNTNNGREAEHSAALERLANLARRTGAEVCAIPGNHDLSGRFTRRDYAERYRDYGMAAAFSRDSASASCAVMTRAGTCLLLLDTNAVGSHGVFKAAGGLSEATIEWVSSVLNGLPEGTPVVSCGHHPLLPAGSRQTTNADQLARALRQGGVRVYLCGHDHGFAAVLEEDLQQITVGQPHAYPGWAGRLTIDDSGMRWRVVDLYAADDPQWLRMVERTRQLGETIARGALENTPYASDEGTIAWFAECFDLAVSCSLTEASCAALLSNPNAQKWLEAQTRTVAKQWMFDLLEHCPQDPREIRIPRD